MSQFFASSGQSIGVSISASVLTVNIQYSIRIDLFDLIEVQGTLKSLLQHHSSKALLWARLPSKKWSSPYSQQKFEMQYLGAISKTTERSVCFQGKRFNITVTQVYAPTINAKES